MLQEQISSPSRNARCAGQKQLSDDGRIAIGSVETDQRHFWWKREVLQISDDGAPRRSQFTAIVAIPLARIRPDPLARVHLCALGCACAPPPRACVLGSARGIAHDCESLGKDCFRCLRAGQSAAERQEGLVPFGGGSFASCTG